MYTTRNFKTKQALRQAVSAYNEAKALQESGVMCMPTPAVTLYAPGLGTPKLNGTEYVEGPHAPAAHTWYAQVTVKDGIVVGVK